MSTTNYLGANGKIYSLEEVSRGAEKYMPSILHAEKDDFSIQHATDTHRMAEDAYEIALNQYRFDNPVPHEGLFACPDCGAAARRPCSTPEVRPVNHDNWLADRDYVHLYGSPAAHFGRRRRAEIARQLYEVDAVAEAEKARDGVIAERRKDYLRARAGVGR